MKQWCLWGKKKKIEKSYYFTRPAQDTTNSHYHFNQTEIMGKWEIGVPHQGKKKQKKWKEKKTGGKLKETN